MADPCSCHPPGRLLLLTVGMLAVQEMLGHLQAGNAAGVEELTRRAASAVAASSTSQAPEVLLAHVCPLKHGQQHLHSPLQPVLQCNLKYQKVSQDGCTLLSL